MFEEESENKAVVKEMAEGEDEAMGLEEVEDDAEEAKTAKKTTIPGIVYLGHIPPRMRPRHVRNMMSVHGEVGRIFLQAEDRFVRKKKKKAGTNAKDFTEGWVEFRDKRVAKLVATSLNNTPMGTRKKNRFHDDLWNMKYLHRFRWMHLSERLAYERQVRQQRMRAEVSQAKRETNFYMQNVEKSKKFAKADRRRAEQPAGDVTTSVERSWKFTQRRTEEEIQAQKARKMDKGDRRQLKQQLARVKEFEQKSQSSRPLLAKIFNTTQARE
ncbi:activator of basal transcription 1 [Ambystoma mexicanum]|uniref:activator of basal transcription 1 n=1 Tax=Ambystoma mexicanum TaxID=8296 RepID=UPI0037E9BD00